MAYAFVQEIAADGAASASTIAGTLASNVTAGNLIYVAVRSATNNTCTVADTLGNTYTLIGSVVEAGTSQELFHFYAKNISGGACTVTATYGASETNRAIYALEISGLSTTSPLVDNAEVTDTGNNPTTNATNTNGGAAGVLISVVNQVNGTAGITVGTGMTSRVAAQWTAVSTRCLVQYRTLSADTSDYTSNAVNPTVDRTNQVAAIFQEPPLPTFSAHPQSVTSYEGQTATFTVTASGTGTLSYQWKDDGSNVGTNSNSYTTAAAVYADDGAQITCVVTDDIGPSTSNAATWTVRIAAKPTYLKA